MLTGTHLGCEHGVCGACTIQIDGAPARSCITYAVACDGSDVQTIEGFVDDPVMGRLRQAFSAQHALQCGYCTPGMLITARDIVLRLPDADEARVRKELAGNLCRCTGYVGIVRAIQNVLAERKGTHAAVFPSSQPGRHPPPAALPQLTQIPPAGSAVPLTGRIEERLSRVQPQEDVARGAGTEDPSPSRAQPKVREGPALGAAGKPQTTLRQSFAIAHRRDVVWDFFGRLDEVTLCLPGASLVGTPASDRVQTRLRVRAGPIVAEFEGAVHAVRDPATYSGTIAGSAEDQRSRSRTQGAIRYFLTEEGSGASTRVDLDIGYTLTGPLAQFSRSNIARDIADRMTAMFADNLEARLNLGDGTAVGTGAHRPRDLSAGSLFFSVARQRLKKLLARLLGK